MPGQEKLHIVFSFSNQILRNLVLGNPLVIDPFSPRDGSYYLVSLCFLRLWLSPCWGLEVVHSCVCRQLNCQAGALKDGCTKMWVAPLLRLGTYQMLLALRELIAKVLFSFDYLWEELQILSGKNLLGCSILSGIFSLCWLKLGKVVARIFFF